MKKNLLKLGAIAALTLTACSQDEPMKSPPSASNATNEIESPYAISVEDALANLEAFLESDKQPGSRSTESRTVASITPIKFTRTASRSIADSLKCDNLLYIANFENNKGYAVLAADERISEKIVAVTDSGNLSKEAIFTATTLPEFSTYPTEERHIYEGYPLTGDGFFTTPETGDELFMNPNTVNLYIEEKDDTLVGNFDPEIYDDEDDEDNEDGEETGLSLTPDKRKPFDPTTALTIPLCVNYAANEITSSGVGSVSLKPNLPPRDLEEGPGNGLQPGDGHTSYYNTKYDCKILTQVNPILADFSSWYQTSPFNKRHPQRRQGYIVGKYRQVPAGCFPLAIAKILTYFRYPGRFIYNNYMINWNELMNFHIEYDKKNRPIVVFETETGALSAAYLLRAIADGCNSWYFYQGTFTFPSNGESYLQKLGFNAHRKEYRFQHVTDMLDNDKPVIIYGMPKINLTKSHCWVIDGYRIKANMTTRYYYNDGEYYSTTIKTDTCKMVHCDFGWRGSCNGYYVSGVFKLNDPRAEYDESMGDNTHYNNKIGIITY